MPEATAPARARTASSIDPSSRMVFELPLPSTSLSFAGVAGFGAGCAAGGSGDSRRIAGVIVRTGADESTATVTTVDGFAGVADRGIVARPGTDAADGPDGVRVRAGSAGTGTAATWIEDGFDGADGVMVRVSGSGRPPGAGAPVGGATEGGLDGVTVRTGASDGLAAG